MNGIGNDNVGRLLGCLMQVVLVVRGLSLADGVGVVLGLVGPICCLGWGRVFVTLYMAVLRIRGVTFSWLYCISVGSFDLLSQKKQKKYKLLNAHTSHADYMYNNAHRRVLLKKSKK